MTEFVIPENSELPARYDAGRMDAQLGKEPGEILAPAGHFASFGAGSSLLPEESYDFRRTICLMIRIFCWIRKAGDYIMSWPIFAFLERTCPGGGGSLWGRYLAGGTDGGKSMYRRSGFCRHMTSKAVKAAVPAGPGVSRAHCIRHCRAGQDSRYYIDKTGSLLLFRNASAQPRCGHCGLG